jgi:aminoglycoside phosphotransferase (APT) family kinase protein
MVWREKGPTLLSHRKPDFNLIPYQGPNGGNQAASLFLCFHSASTMTMLDPERLTLLLMHIAPDASIQEIVPLQLGFSNRSFRMTIIRPGARQDVYILKQYSDQYEHVFGQDAITRARLEHATLSFLRSSGIPCPDPIFFDLEGGLLGSPLIVTALLPGAQILAHPANPLWAAQAPVVGALLARIHLLACPSALTASLPDATAQATWFLKNGSIPDYMRDHPDGAKIWEILHHELPALKSAEGGLVHGDYWSGNILWEHGKLTGILDWENVGFGQPGFDVANCRMEMMVDGMDDAADIFLRTYEAMTGNPVANLGLCELTVAVQPMWQRAPFLTISPYQERFRRFVANARQRV